ncbi:MAG: glycosyltransferase family 9 protein, partial [Flammeovirgaceae bacterium]
MLSVSLDNKKLEVFLSAEENEAARKKLSAYPNPIIIHVTSITTKNQEWPFSNWEQLIAAMPGYTFIQIGLGNEQLISGAVDFRGKTTFREAMALINNALSFAGVVSSFSHATNALDVPGVVLFGASTPEVW